MLISEKWLREFVDPDLDSKELGERLTLIGLEIDGIHETEEGVVYDVEVTSNRGDCISHLGVAREVAAFAGKEVNEPETLDETPQTTDRVKVLDETDCPRFTARLIEGVTVGPSPDWLVKRLEAVGERSINNIADITNLVMHELGQPMHAFDLAKLAGHRLIVRKAVNGETIKTLDEAERKLDESMLAICDEDIPVAVAGIMGGFNSGITQESTDVLLEVANFSRDSIRRTSRALNLNTEASYRFERGVDIENLIRASNRAAKLICDIAGGTSVEFCEVYESEQDQTVVMAPDIAGEVMRLTGLSVTKVEADEILERLGIKKQGDFAYISPSWRHDLSIPEDLVEEIARIIGYDKISTEIPASRSAGEYHTREPRKRRLRTSFAARGFDEAISYSFVDSDAASRYTTISQLRKTEADFVRINDPIIEGADLMRPTLLHGLVESARTNLNHRNKNLKVFEIGRIFQSKKDSQDLPVESETLSILLTGREEFEQWAAEGRELDFFDLKASIEEAAETIGAPRLTFRKATDVAHLQTGQSAAIEFDGKLIGSAGKLSSSIAADYKFKQPVFLAEIDLESIFNIDEAVSVYTPLPVYPSVVRDVSLVVSADTTFDEIVAVSKSGNVSYFESAEYVGTYTGKGMEDDKKSITIRLEYRSLDGTLTDEKVDKSHGQIISKLESTLNAGFR